MSYTAGGEFWIKVMKRVIWRKIWRHFFTGHTIKKNTAWHFHDASFVIEIIWNSMRHELLGFYHFNPEFLIKMTWIDGTRRIPHHTYTIPMKYRCSCTGLQSCMSQEQEAGETNSFFFCPFQRKINLNRSSCSRWAFISRMAGLNRQFWKTRFCSCKNCTQNVTRLLPKSITEIVPQLGMPSELGSHVENIVAV